MMETVRRCGGYPNKTSDDKEKRERGKARDAGNVISPCTQFAER